MIVNIKGAYKAYGDKQLFNNLNLVIQEQERVALIGANGVGKTTLFRVLENEIPLDAGDVFWKAHIRIGFLDQLRDFKADATVREYFASIFTELLALETRLKQLEETMKVDSSEKVLDTYARIQEDFSRRGGYTMETEIQTMLTKFGFTLADMERPMVNFSGGQQTRLAFIRLLLSKPDVLFLDEPTNHLDISTIEWLEGYLSKYEGTLVLISHDRLFLDRICNCIVELEAGTATRYVSNYSGYLKLKEEAVERNNIKYKNQQREIERLEKLIEKYRANPNKASMAQSKIKYLERMDKVEKQEIHNDTFKAQFTAKIRGGQDVLIMNQLVVGYQKPLLTLTDTLHRGHRYAVMGDNGTGKSTLLKTVADRLPALAGEKLLGHQVDIGYFDQELLEFARNKTVLDEVWDAFPQLDHTQIRQALAQFLFRGEDVFKAVAVLSGGERVRLALVKLMLQHNNFLILDEPTNHLDILGKEALEKALETYTGTMLFVSHDRYFVEKMASDIFMINDGKITHTQKDIQAVLHEEKNMPNVEKTERKESYQSLKRKQRQLKKLEANLTELYEDLEVHRELRFDPDYYHDYEKMNTLNDTIDSIHNEIKTKEKEWEALSLLLEENE